MTDTNIQSTVVDTEVPQVPESFLDTQADASRKAAEMGESRKMFAEMVLDAAESSPTLKDRLASLNDSEKSYLEKKFPDRFKKLFSPKTEISLLEKTVESLAKDREIRKSEVLNSTKQSLGLTLEQEAEFNDLVSTFEGRTINGKTITLEKAVEMASLQIRPSSPSSFNPKGDVVRRPEDVTDEVKVNLSQERINKNSFYTGAKSADDFKPMAKQLAEKGSYTIPIGKH